MAPHPLPAVESDPRFLSGVRLFNDGDYFEAGDIFEELYFEAVGGELEFVRAFLQASVGCLHAERRQRRAATERLNEGILAIDRVRDDRGYDLAGLRAGMSSLIEQLSGTAVTGWPRIVQKPD